MTERRRLPNRRPAETFKLEVGDPEAIRKALCRDSQGRASGPLAAVLDMIAAEEGAP